VIELVLMAIIMVYAAAFFLLENLERAALSLVWSSLLLQAALYPHVSHNPCAILWGGNLGLRVDSTAVLTALVLTALGAIFLTYALESGRRDSYLPWAAVLLGSELVVVYSPSLLQMLIFLELVALSCWRLAGPEKKAGTKALATLSLGIAIGVCGVLTKNAPGDTRFLCIAFTSLVIGAQFPLYSWFMDAAATFPASAFIGTGTTVMGPYLLMRSLSALNPSERAFAPVAVAVAVTLVLTGLAYLGQREGRKLLMYAVIANTSTVYVALLVILLGGQGNEIARHLVIISTPVVGLAFLTTDAIKRCHGTTDIDRVRGLRETPPLAYSWAISVFGLAGLPPFGKSHLLIEAASLYSNPLGTLLALLLLANSVAFLYSGIRSINLMVFSDGREEPLKRTVGVPLALLATLSFGLAVALNYLMGVP